MQTLWEELEAIEKGELYIMDPVLFDKFKPIFSDRNGIWSDGRYILIDPLALNIYSNGKTESFKLIDRYNQVYNVSISKK